MGKVPPQKADGGPIRFGWNIREHINI